MEFNLLNKRREYMVKRKKPEKKKVAVKQGVKLIKVNSLTRAELASLNFDELWIMKPRPEMLKRPRPRPRPRYCGCRNVCLV